MNIINKIDGMCLDILGLMAKDPERIFSVDSIFKSLEKKTNYPTVFRRVESLVRQGLISKDKYGATNQLRLDFNNPATLLLLSLVELNTKEAFLNDIQPSLRLNFDKFKHNLNRLEGLQSILVFGSYAKGTYTKDSDIDLIIIYKKEDLQKNRNSFRKKAIRLIKAFQLRTDIELNPIFVTQDDYNEMLKDNEVNVGKESLSNHIILAGEHGFWKGLSGCYQKEN